MVPCSGTLIIWRWVINWFQVLDWIGSLFRSEPHHNASYIAAMDELRYNFSLLFTYLFTDYVCPWDELLKQSDSYHYFLHISSSCTRRSYCSLLSVVTFVCAINLVNHYLCCQLGYSFFVLPTFPNSPRLFYMSIVENFNFHLWLHLQFWNINVVERILIEEVRCQQWTFYDRLFLVEEFRQFIFSLVSFVFGIR